MFDRTIIVRGGGDLGSGVALRLWRAGLRVVILESPCPVAVRRTVAFSEAVYDGDTRVEEAVGRSVSKEGVLDTQRSTTEIPVVVDPTGSLISVLAPFALVDAIMAKCNTGSLRHMAPLVIGLGPGFDASTDVHAVVETNRGAHLGRVLWTGTAQANTGEPGRVSGISVQRVLRAPTSGILQNIRNIGDIVSEGEAVALVGDKPVIATFRSLLRGLARDGLLVKEGAKIGDLDPRLDSQLCSLVSDKSLAVAGGVLEAVFMGLRESAA
ncbi:MAG: selenium-dependent molybdenum cofactor biosynthesis protein YqeB [Chloroflexota bacterium]